MTAPKRRWFQVSLRTLFVVVTVVSGLIIGLSVRAVWLESLARFHEQQASIAADQFYFRLSLGEMQRMDLAAHTQRSKEYRALHDWHQDLALEYRRAIWQPWLRVKPGRTQPPDPEPDRPLVTHSSPGPAPQL
jgi:hypothetical protein